jgi:ABC-type nitrate/sulfonate/bicarbonate transport system substrate-binding protein
MMYFTHKATVLFAAFSAAIVLFGGCKRQAEAPVPSTVPQQATTLPLSAAPLKRIRFANLPYGDHTYSEIGAEKGFFRDVGIDLQAETIKIEEIVPALANGTYDAGSVPPGILFSNHDTAPELRTFCFGDLFQGYALMARPDAGFKQYKEFRAQGLSDPEAVKATVQQMKGHTFAYPTETAIKPFIDVLLSRGVLDRNDIKSLVMDDPLTVNAMRNKEADFQVGGVPSRLTLQKEGFIPLISSVDLAKGAAASPDSKELASILENGWATTRTMYERDFPTVLRLASVNYRIMAFMHSDRGEAIQIHMRYLSRVTGTQFTAKDGAIIYDDLDPFMTFEDQRPWFHDESSPLYYGNVNGAILRSFIADGVYKNAPPSVDDVVFAAKVYVELERLKAEADIAFATISQHISQMSAQQTAILAEAHRQYANYDYYDAVQFSHQVLPQLGDISASTRNSP